MPEVTRRGIERHQQQIGQRKVLEDHEQAIALDVVRLQAPKPGPPNASSDAPPRRQARTGTPSQPSARAGRGRCLRSTRRSSHRTGRFLPAFRAGTTRPIRSAAALLRARAYAFDDSRCPRCLLLPSAQSSMPAESKTTVAREPHLRGAHADVGTLFDRVEQSLPATPDARPRRRSKQPGTARGFAERLIDGRAEAHVALVRDHPDTARSGSTALPPAVVDDDHFKIGERLALQRGEAFVESVSSAAKVGTTTVTAGWTWPAEVLVPSQIVRSSIPGKTW